MMTRSRRKLQSNSFLTSSSLPHGEGFEGKPKQYFIVFVPTLNTLSCDAYRKLPTTVTLLA